MALCFDCHRVHVVRTRNERAKARKRFRSKGCLSGNRVETAGVERMAAEHPASREPASPHRPVPRDCLRREARAARLETTRRSQERRDQETIHPNEEDQEFGYQPREDVHLGQPWKSELSSDSTSCARSPAAPLLAITTTSNGRVSTSRRRRKYSRTRLFKRLRVTAFPTRRVTVMPSRGVSPHAWLGRRAASTTKFGDATRAPYSFTRRKSLELRSRSIRRRCAPAWIIVTSRERRRSGACDPSPVGA